MEQENGSPVSFDHPPSSAELAAFLSQAEENDPRSVFYKRTLVRPKLPIARMVFSVVLTVAVCCVIYFVVNALLSKALIAVLSAIAALVLICLLFAKAIVVNMVKLYQAVAPARLRQRCRYEPSCSAYMLLAVEKYGTWRGLCRGLRRWKGCKPPNGGYDLP